ncbi:glycosyltransferase family 9 protein [Flexibacter flexilis]|uniref:glycosyltransferase family 9 protein n=1 Tax=Flexibacter flexilis TaxID=998 RepID=UPI000B88A800|nr:glycosyltransferase family 9 protein [Flexibacter flexilis]
MKQLSTIVISQTGTLLEVFFTLPLVYVMRQHKENQCKIVFVANEQARPLVQACEWIDFFLSKEMVLADPTLLQQYKAQIFISANNDVSVAKLAKKVQIPVRVGDRNYWRNWFNANKLVNISVLKGKLVRHQMQRIVALAKVFKTNVYFSAEMLNGITGLSKISLPSPEIANKIDPQKFNLVLQLSNPIANLQWPLAKFESLCKCLDNKAFNVIIIAEKQYELSQFPSYIHNLTGRLDLADTMTLLAAADGIVATNTIELQIVSALQKKALGLYNNAYPYTPTNQKPAGNKASVLVEKKHCTKCQNGATCQCLQTLSEQKVLAIIQKWPQSLHNKFNTPISSNTP